VGPGTQDPVPQNAAGADDLAALAATARTAAKGGESERAAWDRIYRTLAPMVHAVLLARVGATDADDLTQEVFARAMVRIAELRDDHALGAWLASMARNEAANFKRGRWRLGAAMLRLVGASGNPRGGMNPSRDPRWSGEEVLAAIRALPEAYQETLIMRLVEGMAGPQIAAALGMTHGSVRVNLTRGMGMLKRRLGLEEQA